MYRVELDCNRIRRGRDLLAALAATIVIGGCSSGAGTGTPGLSSFGERFNQAAATGTAVAQAQPTTESSSVDVCPAIDVRPGASSLAFTAPGGQGAMGLRYQATLGQTARECQKVGGNLNMKVGIQGRIILGPAGGPGTIEVPLRLALVQEGPSPKTHWTKLYRIPITIGEGVPNVAFTHVEEDLTVPMPTGNAIESYVVYVGFDALGAKEQPAKKQPQRKRAQPTG
jgi:hypothetical protein